MQRLPSGLQLHSYYDQLQPVNIIRLLCIIIVQPNLLGKMSFSIIDCPLKLMYTHDRPRVPDTINIFFVILKYFCVLRSRVNRIFHLLHYKGLPGEN